LTGAIPTTDPDTETRWADDRTRWHIEDRPITIHDTTDRKNLLLLIQLRWIAVAGQVVTIWLVHFGLSIPLPLQSMTAVVLMLGALNTISWVRYRRFERVSNTALFLELLLDVSALTMQLYYSGGAMNPFVSLYLLQVILAAVLLEAWSVWTLVVVTSLCFIGLTFFFQPLLLPHDHGVNFLNMHIQGMFICYVLAAVLLVLFVTRITQNLASRNARLAELKQRSIEEDHIVRLGLLASGAAHELGTPLATLSVILNDWRSLPQLRGDPALAEELEEMLGQLDRCKTIVSGILVSSGEARGEGTVHTTIRTFFDDAAIAWQLARLPEGFVYRNGFQPDAPMTADLALRQVLFNLLDNALEASPDWVELEVERQENAVAIRVRDHGPGFPPAQLDQFGKPYSSTKGKPGAGLGLFLVVNVIRRLGGTVTAANLTEGRGALVTVTLPLSLLESRLS